MTTGPTVAAVDTGRPGRTGTAVPAYAAVADRPTVTAGTARTAGCAGGQRAEPGTAIAAVAAGGDRGPRASARTGAGAVAAGGATGPG